MQPRAVITVGMLLAARSRNLTHPARLEEHQGLSNPIPPEKGGRRPSHLNPQALLLCVRLLPVRA